MDRISDLPRHILHRILYFLSQEDAVRTSVLSKSWRYIWCTRPNLHLSYDTFNRTRFTDPYFLYYPLNAAAALMMTKQQEFLSVVDENLQRYCDQRMCLEEFHLSICLRDYVYRGSVSLLEKWIPLLSNMGVKHFRLTIRSEHIPKVLGPLTGRRSLPSVVFGAESLQDLHVKEFLLDQKSIQRVVLLKHLTSLRLTHVEIKEEIFQKIISSCPLIEIMEVEGCEGFSKIEMNGLHNLKDFSFSMHHMISAEELCSIKIHPPSLETIDIRDGNLWFHKGAVFSNLNDLSLRGVKSSLDHLSSCKFPSLEYLGLFDCDALKGIDLFIDAPKIVSFEYGGDFVPSISFGTTSNEHYKKE